MGSSILAFDFGLRRIGVAVGEPALQTANGIAVVSNRDAGVDWPHIDTLIAEWQPVELVIGIPRHPDGGDSELTHAAMAFGETLGDRYRITVSQVDERYSSKEAERRLADARSRGHKQRRTRHEDIDMLAAQIILERWYQSAAQPDTD